MTVSNKIITENIEFCYQCGTKGKLLQGSVSDPDHQIPGDWSYKTCLDGCQTVWLDPRPLESELLKAYSSYHTHTKLTSLNFLEKSIFSIFKRLIKLILSPLYHFNGLRAEAKRLKLMDLGESPKGYLLDIGCGGGRFLARMKKRNWSVEGLDIDPEVVKKVSKKYGILVHAGDVLNHKFPDNTYDVITMNQTIEHLYNPSLVLKECFRILKPGGHIVMTTPNVDCVAARLLGEYWRGWEPPRHLFLFNPKSISKVVSSAGFEVTSVATYSCESAIGYYASEVNKKTIEKTTIGLVNAISILFWSYRMELEEFNEKKVNPNIGQGLFLSAIKPFSQ
jgi:2-polyprenyl-3-methyl-5-hydroxy-6-metoxy-1,4-benzoquinol methylase